MLTSDCLIIGGGVIGLSVAWELAQRGASVTVLDRQRIGGAASWAGAGILPPANFATALDPLDQLRGLSHQLHPRWAARLQEETGIDTGFRRCGGLYLARSAGEAAVMAGQVSYWEAYGIEAEKLTPEALVEDQPALAACAASGRLQGGWLVPDECQLRNPDHLQALRTACAQRGVRLWEGSDVRLLEEPAAGGVVVRTAEQTWNAELAVIAGGAWTPALADAIGFSTGIVPVRGQMVLYRLPTPPLTRVVNEGHRYLVPRLDGHLLVGSSEEEVGYQCETTESVIGSLRAWAEDLLPLLQDASIEQTWAGLRPATVDEFPYIGRVPGQRRTWIAAGHFRSGLHLSCATAVVIADLIAGQDPPLAIDAFRPGRG